MRFTNKVYDVLKDFALIYLPLVAAFYITFADLWHLPNAEAISGTIMAFDTLLGGILKLSNRSYEKTDKYDGTVDVSVDPEGKKTFSLNVDGDLDKLDQKEEILFKVNPKVAN